MACSGDSSEICGGPNAINIYIDASNVPATVVLPSGWTTYGVVTEGQNGRLLPIQILNDQTNTVEVCANACAAAGYTISGTEYSSECYCGNAFSAVSTLKRCLFYDADVLRPPTEVSLSTIPPLS